MRRLIIGLPIMFLMTGVAAAEAASPQPAVRPQHVAPPDVSAAQQGEPLNEAQPLDGAEDDQPADGEDDVAALQPDIPMELPLRRPEPPTDIPEAKLAPANDLFGSVAEPAPLAARAIGGYTKGCLSGGVSLPINGPDWQVMRVSRNRNWGAPQLIDYMERLASDAHALDGWPGLLVGDLSQPRGGPMITGHTSHQIGLDADIWLTPMPDRVLTDEEREEMTAVSMLKDPFTVDPEVFTDLQVKLIRRAASYRQVGRIFVHPAIKKALCARADVAGKNKAWLAKVRPWWNHHYHFHVRLNCPPGMAGCDSQAPVSGDIGCDDKDFKYWDKKLKISAKWATDHGYSPLDPIRRRPSVSDRKNRGKLGELPKECQAVLTAGGVEPLKVGDELPEVAVRAATSKDAGPGVPVLTKEELAIALGQKPKKVSMQAPERNPIR
jgi:penicillin-insensitive murein DD-endopeptidase